MSRNRIWQRGLGLLLLAAASAPCGWAETSRAARLEALLTQQQERIEVLRQQVASAAAQNEDAGRAELLRQQIREVLSEQEFREGLMPPTLQAGYDDGFFIKSSDDKFSMTINGYVQFRWTYYQTRSRNRYLSPGMNRSDRSGFDLSRARLIIGGSAYSEDLTYYMEFNADGPNGFAASMTYAYVDYRFCDAFHVTAGIIPLVGTRGTWVNMRGYQFIDRPMTDVVFSLGDGVGVQFWGTLFDDKFEYYLNVANSMTSSAGRTITNDEAIELDNNPAVAFRAIWHALGQDPDGWGYESDVDLTPEPMLDLGFHYGFNDDHYDADTTPIPFPRRSFLRDGGFALTNTNGLQINQFGLDAAFKYRGFYVAGNYTLRLVDVRAADGPPFAPWFALTGDDSTTAQHGAYVTMGYFLPIPGFEDRIEAVARVGGISTLAHEREGTWEYGAGVNYYLRGAEAGHMTKLQMDVTRVSEVPIDDAYSSLANVNDDALVLRVQLQVGF